MSSLSKLKNQVELAWFEGSSYIGLGRRLTRVCLDQRSRQVSLD